jgi:hypothetical protein
MQISFTLSDRHLRAALIAVVFYVILLVIGGLTMDQKSLWFREGGIIEVASFLFWLGAALVPLYYVREHAKKALLFTLVFLMFAAREADWHKSFTGESILNLNHYDGRLTVGHYISAVIAILLVLAVGAMLVMIGRYLLRQGGWKQPSGKIITFAALILIGIKFLDRLPAIMHKDFGYLLSPTWKSVLHAVEEGVEMALPLLFTLALAAVPNLISQEKPR